MAVRTDSFNPLLISERLEPNDLGQLDLCRACSFLMVWDAATNGDATTNPNGSRWGRAQIKNTLVRMRKATGEELRGAYNTSHMDEFARGAGIPVNAWHLQLVKFSEVVQGLRDGYAYTLSGDVKGTPAGSPLRKYVNGNVGHDIALIRLSENRKQIAFIDPMTPHGTRKYVRWAPVSHFQKFANAFKDGDGRVVAGRIEKGWWSKLQTQKRAWQTMVRNARERTAVLMEELKDAHVHMGELESDIVLLETQLAECTQADCTNCEAALEDAISKLDRIEAIVLE